MSFGSFGYHEYLSATLHVPAVGNVAMNQTAKAVALEELTVE